jgi:hypothetical protein
VSGAAIRQVVAVHAGNHHVAQAEFGDGIGHAGRLGGVEGRGQAGRHVAEGAGARADFTQDHHGGVALAPALADVGAGGFLAHRDEAVVAHQAAGLVVDRVRGRLNPDPLRLALDGVIGAVGLLRVALGTVVYFYACGHSCL